MDQLKQFLSTQKDLNFLCIVDTYSFYKTGGLYHGKGPTGAQWIAPINDVCDILHMFP